MNQPLPLNASSRIMYLEAQSQGIETQLLGDKETIFMKQGNLEWYTRGSRTSIQSSVGKTIADNKSLTKKVLLKFGLPTAAYVHVSSPDKLTDIKNLSFPLVMKPVAERHGKGVVVGIKSFAEAEKHYEQAESRSVLFEEMLAGTEYRIVCVDHICIAAAFRKPAHVVGDGQHTVQELIDEKNQHPWRGKGHQNNLSLLEIDQLVTEYLAEQGYTLSDVPALNQEVMLRKTANLSTGGEAWDVTDQVCAENKELFGRIAQVCDLNIVGIDIMCESLSTPLVNQPKAGVIEINASPGLRMHHFPMQGQPRNVAQAILDLTIRKLSLYEK